MKGPVSPDPTCLLVLFKQAQLLNMISQIQNNSNSSGDWELDSDAGSTNPRGCGSADGEPAMIIWTTNIRGIATNFDALAHAVSDSCNKPDLIFWNETLIAPKKIPTSGIYEIEGLQHIPPGSGPRVEVAIWYITGAPFR